MNPSPDVLLVLPLLLLLLLLLVIKVVGAPVRRLGLCGMEEGDCGSEEEEGSSNG